MNLNSAAIGILQEFLQKLTGLSAEETMPLFSTTQTVQLSNNQVYIPIGDKSRKLAFIEKGVMRAYAVKDNGDEATLYIRWEGQFIASRRYHHQLPALPFHLPGPGRLYTDGSGL